MKASSVYAFALVFIVLGVLFAFLAANSAGEKVWEKVILFGLASLACIIFSAIGILFDLLSDLFQQHFPLPEEPKDDENPDKVD